MYWYVLISVDTGFRSSHRDAAMPPPSADHASTEDRDPHPCPEDEEFFECRPDAVDMEEVIGKFMEGMEKQERTGYAAKLAEWIGPTQVQQAQGVCLPHGQRRHCQC